MLSIFSHIFSSVLYPLVRDVYLGSLAHFKAGPFFVVAKLLEFIIDSGFKPFVDE